MVICFCNIPACALTIAVRVLQRLASGAIPCAPRATGRGNADTATQIEQLTAHREKGTRVTGWKQRYVKDIWNGREDMLGEKGGRDIDIPLSRER